MERIESYTILVLLLLLLIHLETIFSFSFFLSRLSSAKLNDLMQRAKRAKLHLKIKN